MKKDKKPILKSLIIAAFLLLGHTAFAQHPLLGPDELDVYVLPGQQQISIGKQANDEGRTCYKWYGPFNGYEERIGSLQVFGRPSYMTPGSNFEFELTVIGEQYYQQTVTVHVIGNITFQVQPIKGCISGNEIPVIEDFEITTNPLGYEYLVSIDYSQCHQYDNGNYLVFFQLVVNGVMQDSHSVIVINTGMVPPVTSSHSVEQAGNLIRGIVNLTNYIAKVFRSGIEPPTLYGGWTITKCLDCCETTKQQRRLDLDGLGGKAGFHVNLGNPIPVYGFLFGFRGGFELELGVSNLHGNLNKTCNPLDGYLIGEFHGAASISIGVFIEDFTGGALLSATGGLASKFSFENMKTIVTGYTAHTEGTLWIELYVQSEITLISWFKQQYKTPLITPIDIPLIYYLPLNE